MATFSYLYTNDVRIATLQEKIMWVANAYLTDTVPNSSVDKSASNNFATIAYYFGLTRNCNLTKAAAMGNADLVILNFIKKFQYPNPRTSDSLQNEVACGEKFAPLREIVKVLVQFHALGLDSYLTLEEIRLFLFYNAAIAKRENYNLIELCHQIVKYRTDGNLPTTITVPNPIDEFWKHETRQVRELTNILKKVKCIKEIDGEFHLDAKSLTYQLKGLLFDIVTYDSYWEGASRESYAEYFDITDEEVNLFDKDIMTSNTPSTKNISLQTIYYGAPGTGKSYTIQQMTNDDNSVRITFHPDSDYASFVGAYKPTMTEVPVFVPFGSTVTEAINGQGKPVKEKKIQYEFIPQAFLTAYVEAWKRMAQGAKTESPAEDYYLVIEEINRGNCAQIFGDLFQLLDRNADGFSSYSIKPDKDLQNFLATSKEGFADPEAFPDGSIPEKIRTGQQMLLPPNLHIWATMNTSDQSLFPIDSAFKRRWDWVYIPISQGVDKNTGNKLEWVVRAGGIDWDWWSFLEQINPVIYSSTQSEDKKLGFFFARATGGVITAEQFVGKVIFYIWNDVFKDFGLDRDEFKDHNAKNGENDRLTFDKFFMPDGSPNEDNVVMLMENLKVKKVTDKEEAIEDTAETE